MTYAGDRTSEPSLYDLDAKAEAESINGAQPPLIESKIDYLETEDETELRSIIFQSSDVLEKLIDIPEWKVGGKVIQVLVRGLTAREWAQFQNANMKNGVLDLVKGYPDMAILAARHPVTKKLLFKPTDRDALMQKMGKALERIAIVAADLSGISKRMAEELEKN